MGLGTMNEDLVKEKNKILEDLAAMTDKYNTSHDNVKDANESIDRLELQVHAIEMEREVSIERNQVLVGEKECALAEMEGLRKQLDESQATAIDLRAAIADWEGNAILMKIEIDSLSGKSMGLGTMNEDLVKEKNKILEDLAAMTDKYNTSHDNVKDANESIDRLELQVNSIQMDFANLVQEKNNLQTSLENSAGENAELNTKLGSAINEVGVLKDTLEKSNEREQDILRKTLQISKQRDELLGEAGRLREELGNLSAELSNTKAQAMRQIEELSRQNIDLLSNSKELGDQLAALHVTFENLTNEKQNANEQIKLLAEQHAAIQKQATDFQMRLQDVLGERALLLKKYEESQSYVAELTKERTVPSSTLDSAMEELNTLKVRLGKATARETDLKKKMLKMAQDAEALVVAQTAQLREDLAQSKVDQQAAMNELERYMASSNETNANYSERRKDVNRRVKHLEMKVNQLTKDKEDLQARATKQIEELERLLRTKKGGHFDVECKACGAPLHVLFRTPERKRQKGSVWERLHKSGTYASNAHKLCTETSSCDRSVSSQVALFSATPSTPSSNPLTTPKKSSRQATPRDLETTFRRDEGSRTPLQLRS